jgi:hypothetical protein
MVLYCLMDSVNTRRQLIVDYNIVSISEVCGQQTISRIDGLVHEPADRNILHVQQLVAVEVYGNKQIELKNT